MRSHYAHFLPLRPALAQIPIDGALATIGAALDTTLSPLLATSVGSDDLAAVVPDLSLALAARTLAEAAQREHPLISADAAVVATLRRAQIVLDRDTTARTRIGAALTATGSTLPARDVEVTHLVTELAVSSDAITMARSRPLDGLTVAAFSGCHASVNERGALESVIAACGATPLSMRSGRSCCGAALAGVRDALATSMAAVPLGEAAALEADILVTATPCCGHHLKVALGSAERLLDRDLDVPVLHLAEFVALALGSDALGTRRNSLSPLLLERLFNVQASAQ